MYEREIKAMEAAALLLNDIERHGGLKEGGEQYPNGLCCIDYAQQLVVAAKRLRELDAIKAIRPTGARLSAMVDRFLGWKLPDSFGPDCFVTFDRERAKANQSWPIGTNILGASEARAMLEHILSGLDPITDERAKEVAQQWGCFEPSRWADGMPQFHTGLPGVLGLCRAVWAEALGLPLADGAKTLGTVPLRRAEDLSPAAVANAISDGEVLTVDFRAGEVVDAEVWREWDGTPVVTAHRYMLHPKPNGGWETYGPPWPMHRAAPCPCPDQKVQVKHRDGAVTTTDAAQQMRWGWTRPYASAADIVAWRPIV